MAANCDNSEMISMRLYTLCRISFQSRDFLDFRSRELFLDLIDRLDERRLNTEAFRGPQPFTILVGTAAPRSAFHFCPNCGSTTSGHRLPERAGSNLFCEDDRNLNPSGSRWAASPVRTSRLILSAWEEVIHPWLGAATATEHFSLGRPPTC